jgi:hypothetical protein
MYGLMYVWTDVRMARSQLLLGPFSLEMNLRCEDIVEATLVTAVTTPTLTSAYGVGVKSEAYGNFP